MNIRDYCKPQTLEEAWQENQKKSAVLFAGGGWLCLQPKRPIGKAVDVSDVLDGNIEERDDEIYIGAMATLRQLETSSLLIKATNGAIKEALRHIVGVQFRNRATIGGSLWSRFGFSDVLTLFLALRADVTLYKGGRIALSDFARQGYDTDILVSVHIPKVQRTAAYASLRLNATDFPIICCAVSREEDRLYCAVGARPLRGDVRTYEAKSLESTDAIEKLAQDIADSFVYDSNMRGSSQYRHDMAAVLCRRLLHTIKGERR